jgi:putative transposase
VLLGLAKCPLVANGRRVKCLTVVDDFTKEVVRLSTSSTIMVSQVCMLIGHWAAWLASSAVSRRERTDQGSEFTSRALNLWAYASGVTLKLIQADKPTQNAYIESFNGQFRDECLNEPWVTTLAYAQAVTSQYGVRATTSKGSSALTYLSPSEFAAKHWAVADAPAAFQ